jgi:hypothetical protein
METLILCCLCREWVEDPYLSGCQWFVEAYVGQVNPVG